MSIHSLWNSGVALVFVALVRHVAAADLSVDSLIGLYVAPASKCSIREGERLVPCDGKFRDYMLIARAKDESLSIVIESTQRDGAECGLVGHLEINNNHISIIPSAESIASGVGNFFPSLNVSEDEIRLVYPSVKYQLSVDPFCGFNASLDGIAFRRTSRVDSNCRCDRMLDSGPRGYVEH